MEKFITATGKTIDLAIAAALEQLRMDRDSVSVEVLDNPKSGFLGIGAQPARVKVTYEAPDEAPKPALSSASRSKPKKPAEPKPADGAKVIAPAAPKVIAPAAPEAPRPAETRAAAPKAPQQPRQDRGGKNRGPKPERRDSKPRQQQAEKPAAPAEPKVYAPAEPGNVRMLLKGDSIDVWPMRETTVGEMKLSFCPVRHPVETFAVCVECDGARLVYTGDTNTDFALELFCDSADLLLADAGLPAEKHTESSPHLSAALCGKLARDTHSRRLLLTHLNPKFDASALLREAQEVFPAAELAVCGESWYI